MLESIPCLGRPFRWLEQRLSIYRFKILHQKHLKQLALLADANEDDSVSPEEVAESLDKDANGEVRSSLNAHKHQLTTDNTRPCCRSLLRRFVKP